MLYPPRPLAKIFFLLFDGNGLTNGLKSVFPSHSRPFFSSRYVFFDSMSEIIPKLVEDFRERLQKKTSEKKKLTTNSCIFRCIYNSFKMSEQTEVFCFFWGKINPFFPYAYLTCYSRLQDATLVFHFWKEHLRVCSLARLLSRWLKNTKSGCDFKFALFWKCETIQFVSVISNLGRAHHHGKLLYSTKRGQLLLPVRAGEKTVFNCCFLLFSSLPITQVAKLVTLFLIWKRVYLEASLKVNWYFEIFEPLWFKRRKR